MSKNENMEIIKQLPRRDRLEALAEEANELAQAALKVIRAEKLSKNPTPKPDDEAKLALNEEFYDVLIAALALDFKIPSEEFLLNNFKVKRWADRIKGAKDEDAKVYLVEMLNFDVAEAEASHTYLMKRAIPLSKQTIVEIFATYEEAQEWVEKNSEWYKKNVADFHEFDIVCYYLRHHL